MNDLLVAKNTIPPMTNESIETVRQFEKEVLLCPQVDTPFTHMFHAGVYARTLMIPAGVVLTGALIKIPTVLIVSGDAIVYVGGEAKEISGYNVLAASANRKQAFIAKTNVYLTMIFSTDVKTVEEAEEMFTDESDLLASRNADATNDVIVTGE